MLALILSSTSLEAQKKKCTGETPDTMAVPRIYRDCEVDKRAALRGRKPRLDMTTLNRGSLREGCYIVELEMVVDTTGRVEPASIITRRSEMRDLEAAMRDAAPDLVYVPAVKDGVKVRQVVQYREAFAIATMVVRSTTSGGAPPAGRPPMSASRCT